MGFALEKDLLPRYTYDEYILWEGNWELIEGIPYSMSPSPSFKHQRITASLITQLEEKLKACGHCKALPPFDWKIDENTVVQPDISVICEPVNNQNFLDFAPEIIFEIISPSSVLRDRKIKFALYQSEGVKYYVLADPETETIEIYEFFNTAYRKMAAFSSGDFDFVLKDECKIAFQFKHLWTA